MWFALYKSLGKKKKTLFSYDIRYSSENLKAGEAKEMSSENQNPRKWRYTWEAQSHLPLLKLFIFSPEINPITHCNHLNVDLIFEKSLITFTWKLHDSSNSISLLIPLPRVLVDLDSPLNFRPFEDHIQVQIPLLLPVDHPIVSSFISELNSSDQFSASNSSQSFLQPLSIDSGTMNFC